MSLAAELSAGGHIQITNRRGAARGRLLIAEQEKTGRSEQVASTTCQRCRLLFTELLRRRIRLSGQVARPPHPPPDVQVERSDQHRPDDESVEQGGISASFRTPIINP
jgi:hypothetical protein